MKNIKNQLVVLFFIAFTFPHLGSSQDSLNFELSYEVNRVYPSLSITKEKLNEARTLVDLNKYYKPSWVKEYISVEILLTCKGKVKKFVSKNDTISQVQKDSMGKADVGTDISISVEYMPKNTLKYNEAKESNFTFTVEPENQAKYIAGIRELRQYFKENVMDKISPDSFQQYNLTAVKFAIDEAGQIVDAHVFESSKDEKLDKLLLEAVCNMSGWKSAEYASGLKVKQEFVLTVGDHTSCVINLLNIREDLTVRGEGK